MKKRIKSSKDGFEMKLIKQQPNPTWIIMIALIGIIVLSIWYLITLSLEKDNDPDDLEVSIIN